MTQTETIDRPMGIIHTEMVNFCIISGDPGCLGWPDWHHHDCTYEAVECQFCDCGGNDVYGEMYHLPECPLSQEGKAT